MEVAAWQGGGGGDGDGAVEGGEEGCRDEDGDGDGEGEGGDLTECAHGWCC